MSVLFDGLVHATGESDTGKTLFALSCGAQPERTAFFDDDVKGAPLARKLHEKGHPFGQYVDLVKLGTGLREVEFHGICLHEIGKIEARSGEFNVIIWDNWAKFAKTCHDYVVQHPSLFRQFWAAAGNIKGAQQWLSAFDYEAEIISRLLSIAPLVILTSHLKSARRGGAAIPGKFTPDCTRAIVQKSCLRVWLRRNPDSPEPIGLLLKRLSKVEVGEEGMKPINVLPLRMKPCTWAEIRRYWEEPMGNRQPTKEETPDAFELSLLEGTLTEDQERTFQLMLRQRILGDEEPEETTVEEAVAEKPTMAAQVPGTWQELLSRTGRKVGDLSPNGNTAEGLRIAQSMTKEQIAQKLEEWEY